MTAASTPLPVPDLHAATPAQLRARRTLKWTAYPPDVLPMWVAEMDFPVCREVTAALERAVAAEGFGYPSRLVLEELEAVHLDWQRRAHGWRLDPAAGAAAHAVGDVMHGVSLAIRHFSGPDDPVVIPAPVYMPFFDVVALTGRPQIRVPMAWDATRWSWDLDAIDAALAAGARTVLISHPHNPLGRAFDRAELAGLAAVVERHGARVVSDEIHAPLTFARAHIPYAATGSAAAAHTITVTSASKAWNLPGLKCAQVITSNAADTERWRAIPLPETVGVSILGLEAALAAYRHGERWLAAVRATIAEHVALTAAAVGQWPGVRTIPNEATYLQWLDFTDLDLDEEPAVWLRRAARVAVTAGVPFGAPARRFARLNVATTRPLLEEGLERIGRAVRSRAG